MVGNRSFWFLVNLTVIVVTLIDRFQCSLRFSLPNECTERVICDFQSYSNDVIEKEDLNKFPFVRVLNDFNDNSSLMEPYGNFKGDELELQIRKVVTNSSIYYGRRRLYKKYSKDLLDPPLADLNRSMRPNATKARPAAYHSCLREHCKRLEKLNLTNDQYSPLQRVLECNFETLATFDDRDNNNTLKKTCLDEITYLDFRYSTINLTDSGQMVQAVDVNSSSPATINRSTVKELTNVLTLQVDFIANLLRTENNLNVLKHLIPNLLQLKISDSVNNLNYKQVRQLVGLFPYLSEMETNDFLFWPVSDEKVDVYDKIRKCLFWINIEHDTPLAQSNGNCPNESVQRFLFNEKTTDDTEDDSDDEDYDYAIETKKSDKDSSDRDLPTSTSTSSNATGFNTTLIITLILLFLILIASIGAIVYLFFK